VKVSFDSGALLRLFLLAGSIIGFIFIAGLIQSGSLSFSVVLTAALISIGAWLLFIFFRVSLYVYFGLFRAAARITTSALAKVSEVSLRNVYLLFQHIYLSFQLGNFSEALTTVDKIQQAHIPEELWPLVALDRASALDSLFRFREAEEVLQNYDAEDYSGNALVLWQACLANIKAGLDSDLEEALQLAESAFARKPLAMIATVMGHVIWRMGHHEAASSWFDYALRRMPRKERCAKSYAFFLQGKLLRDLGEEEAAERAFAGALSFAPSQECRDLYWQNW
jgi:tetratricopeptide (TPR) repeat protein